MVCIPNEFYATDRHWRKENTTPRTDNGTIKCNKYYTSSNNEYMLKYQHISIVCQHICIQYSTVGNKNTYMTVYAIFMYRILWYPPAGWYFPCHVAMTGISMERYRSNIIYISIMMFMKFSDLSQSDRSCDRSRIPVPDLGGTGVWPGKNGFHKKCKNVYNIAVHMIVSLKSKWKNKQIKDMNSWI